MDTLEYRTEVFKEEGERRPEVAVPPPVIWRGKSAREIYQEQYFHKDYTFKKHDSGNGPVPKSTRGDMDYCEQYTVTPNSEQIKSGYYNYSTLVEIPEKK